MQLADISSKIFPTSFTLGAGKHDKILIENNVSATMFPSLPKDLDCVSWVCLDTQGNAEN